MHYLLGKVTNEIEILCSFNAFKNNQTLMAMMVQRSIAVIICVSRGARRGTTPYREFLNLFSKILFASRQFSKHRLLLKRIPKHLTYKKNLH